METIEQSSLQLVDKIKGDDWRETVNQYLAQVNNDNSWISLPPLPDDRNWLNTHRSLSSDDLLGKVVLLDFFTYCCINCIHMLPFVHEIEHKYSISDGLVVVGIHSAKFPNEKVSDNISSFLSRYEITHPVRNDSDCKLWNKLAIRCWPTFVVISPTGKILLSLPGESHFDAISRFISEALQFYKSQNRISDHKLPLLSIDEVDATVERLSMDGDKVAYCQIKFPGKIAIDSTGEHMAIADTGNHRILICTKEGEEVHVVGAGNVGNNDGDFDCCRFNSPQGVAWRGSKSVFVADTNNHLVRKIDLQAKRVVTVVGTGHPGHDREGGESGTDQPICSPWDVQVGGSPRCPDKESILYIAMAGLHQIWVFFLHKADWQKGYEYELGTCLRFVGNGKEENRNNSYPHKAGLAQPSALTIDHRQHEMYVADSESSTVRKISLASGSVEALVGGHFDPTNLFAFGDADGKSRDVKLQHPLGVAWDQKRSLLYVADTYNHKIKVVDPGRKTCRALCGPDPTTSGDFPSHDLKGFDAVRLNEPAGICLNATCERLYVADCNNHRVVVLDLGQGSCTELTIALPRRPHSTGTTHDVEPPRMMFPRDKRGVQVVTCARQTTSSRRQRLEVRVEDEHLDVAAPSSWQLGVVTSDDEYAYVARGPLRVDGSSAASFRHELVDALRVDDERRLAEVQLCVEMSLIKCAGGACSVRQIQLFQPIFIGDDDSTLLDIVVTKEGIVRCVT